MSALFSPLALRSVTFPHRVFVSPMCQYSSEDGMPNEWHLVHLGSRAVGGAALVLVEASGVTPEGRITPWDSGIWSRAPAEACRPVAEFIRAQGSLPGIPLAPPRRKASCYRSRLGGTPLAPRQCGWTTLRPSETPFGRFSAILAMTHAVTTPRAKYFRVSGVTT